MHLIRLTLIGLSAWLFLLPELAAQEAGTVRGIIVESGSSTRLGSATIMNKRTGQTTASNGVGTFEIHAQVGDTLTITLMGYDPATTEIKTLSDILIDLKRSTIILQQVDITRTSKKSELESVMRDYRKQGVYFNGKPPVLAYFANPLTSLYELVGRTPRNARRFANYMERELAETEVDQKFNRARIRELTGLDGEDLNNFMIWYRPSYEKSQYWNEYDVTNYIVQSFKQFDRDGRPTAPKLPNLQADH